MRPHLARTVRRLLVCFTAAALACAGHACSPGTLPGSPGPLQMGGGGGRYDGTISYRRVSGADIGLDESAQALSMTLVLASGQQFSAQFESSGGTEGTLQGTLTGGLTNGSFRATILVGVPSPGSTCEGRGEVTGTIAGALVSWTGHITYANCGGLVTEQEATAAATSPIPRSGTRAHVLVTVRPGLAILDQGPCGDGTTGYLFTVDLSETSGVAVTLDDTVTVEERLGSQTVRSIARENPVRRLGGGERRSWIACAREPGSYQVFFTGIDANGHTIRAASPVVTFGGFLVIP